MRAQATGQMPGMMAAAQPMAMGAVPGVRTAGDMNGDGIPDAYQRPHPGVMGAAAAMPMGCCSVGDFAMPMGWCSSPQFR